MNKSTYVLILNYKDILLRTICQLVIGIDMQISRMIISYKILFFLKPKIIASKMDFLVIRLFKESSFLIGNS